MNRDLVFTPQARENLEELFWHIAEDDARRAARYIEDIRKACEPLRDLPFIGPRRT